MGGEWQLLPLGQVATLQRGFDLPNQERTAGKIPVISSSGPSDWHSEAKVKGPGVVTGRYGTIGQVFYVEDDFWPLNTTLWVKDFHGNLPRFIYYLLQTIDFHQFNDKSSVPGVNRNHVHAYKVRVPPLETQRAIAHVLGTLDDKIELNRRMNRTLEAMAKALFKSWFVDFDPVRAKAEGRQPEGMGAQTAALFPDGFGEDGLPRGWTLSTIGEETEIVGGSTPSTKEPRFWDGDYHWVTPKDLSSLSDPILLDTERKITELGLQEISSGLLPKGTVLMSSRAPIGYLAVTQIPVATNQGFISMKCNKRLPSWYVLHWAEYNMEEIKGRANGTTFLEVSKANFRTLGIIVPNKEVLLAFEEFVGGLYKQVVLNLEESRTLAALRDALLPKLLSGEVSVAAVEKMLAEQGL